MTTKNDKVKLTLLMLKELLCAARARTSRTHYAPTEWRTVEALVRLGLLDGTTDNNKNLLRCEISLSGRDYLSSRGVYSQPYDEIDINRLRNNESITQEEKMRELWNQNFLDRKEIERRRDEEIERKTLAIRDKYAPRLDAALNLEDDAERLLKDIIKENQPIWDDLVNHINRARMSAVFGFVTAALGAASKPIIEAMEKLVEEDKALSDKRMF